MTTGLQRHLPWLAGFFLMANLYLLPWISASPRILDLGGTLAACWLVWSLARGRLAVGPLVILAIASLLPLLWFMLGLLDGDQSSLTQGLRWLLAIPVALALLQLMTSSELQRRFAWGMLAGGGVNVAVVILQVLGLDSYLQLAGLSTADASWHHWVGFSRRIPGLHGHHNSSSAVISLMVPVGMFLYYRRQMSIGWLLAVLAGLLVALHLTSTRSPAIVTALTIAFAGLAARKFNRILLIGLVMLTVVTPLVMVYGPPGGWSRWRDPAAVETNARERIESNQGALEIIFEHPIGLGVTRGSAQLADKTSFRSTHNAFLGASLHFGLMFGLIIMVAMAAAILRNLGDPEHPSFLITLLAFHLAGLFMFEEHLNNPTFIVLTFWIVATLAWREPTEAGRIKESGPEDLPPVP